MITTTVKGLEEVKELEFPKLMKGSSGVVVLFSSPEKGIVIIGTKCDYIAGEYGYNFTMSNFKDFNEEITLKNKQ